MLTSFVAAAAEGGETNSVLLPAPADLIWGTVAFVIILVVVIWKVLPALNKLLDERSDAIAGGIKRAEEAQAEANAALERYNAQLAEARGRGRRDPGARPHRRQRHRRRGA